MAFPTLEFVKVHLGTNITVHDCVYPTTSDYDIQSGDLILIFLSCDGTSDTPSVTESGYTQLYAPTSHGGHGSSIYYKSAAGTEGDTGDLTYEVTCSSAEELVAMCVVISDWHGTTPPEAATPVEGTSTGPDSPSLSPSWGAEDTRWFSFVGMDGGGTSKTVTTWPTNYADGQNESASTAVFGAIASRAVNATSENPGAWLVSASEEWVAHTVAVRPGSSVTITDVNTTESWDDGDTGLVITGTGFT